MKKDTGRREEEQVKKKKRHSVGHAFFSFFKSVLSMTLTSILLACVIGVGYSYYVVKNVKPNDIDIDAEKYTGYSVIYATDKSTGTQTVSAKLDNGQKREWVTLSQIPDDLKNAFICTEDKRFYKHEGVDWKRTFSSFFNLYFHFYSTDQGGSTITQQLVNNITKSGKRVDYKRKVQEIVDALNVEKKYTKDDILESYLNTINFGEGCYGVEAAANRYFGEHASGLTLTQCAALASLPKAPTTYDPYLHPDNNSSRRKLVLYNMLSQDKINTAQYNAAVNAPLGLIANKAGDHTINSWFTDMVIGSVKNDLIAKKGYSASAALDLIYTGGLQIYSTMDPSVQSAMDTIYVNTDNADYWMRYPGTAQPQSSMAVIGYDGSIAGVEGGRGGKSGNMVFDRATSSKRQPGSAIKPLGVYAPAIDAGKITWATPISKSQLPNWNNGQPGPANDEPGYSGNMSVVDALAQSVNTCAVHIEKDYLSPQYIFSFLKDKLGFSTLVDSRQVKDKNGRVIGAVTDKIPSIAIGGMTDGVTVLEMAGGYQIFGNGGKFIPPYCYTKVTDAKGNVILQNNPAPVQVISPQTAFIMNMLLQQDVTRPYATGREAALPYCPVGGKTGTTNSHYDRWFAGITPNYVGVVWFGYDSPKDIDFYSSLTNPALRAWRNVMNIIQSQRPRSDFPSCPGVAEEHYDPSTGNISPNGPQTGWFKAGQ